MTKLLIDPVYTGRPSTCSTSYLAWEIIRDLAAWRADAFFYLLCPQDKLADETQRAFLEQFPERVKLVPIEAITMDRMQELQRFTSDLTGVLHPGNLVAWDADIIITSRIPQMVNFRTNLGRPNAFGRGTYQAIYGLEEMPIYSFRDTVPWGNTGEMDLHSLAAYQMADGVIINNLWTKTKVTQVARQWLSPSRVRELDGKMYEAVPVTLERLKLKTKLWQPGETFNVAFVGRVTGTRNFQEVAELFRKQFSFGLGKEHVKFIVSTQSQSFGSINVGEIDFVDVEHNGREAFHQMLKERAHVVVNLSTVEDFSLSTYEPLAYGVPVIVPDREWTGFLGKDYPFRAADFTEAYALVREIIHDYATMYDKFRAWEQTTWAELVAGPRNVKTADILKGLIEQHEAKLMSMLDTREVGARYREIVAKVVAEGRDKVDMRKLIEDEGLLPMDHKGLVPLNKRPSYYLLKVLMNRAGYRDTVETGVVEKAG